MDTQRIIAELEAERDRLTKAIAALRGRGRRGAKTGNARTGNAGRGQRHMSAAARQRISDAMKKRWAARKKAL